MPCLACTRIPPVQRGGRDRPCEAPATFPQSMPVVERRGEYLTRDSRTLGSAEQERLKGGKRPPSACSAEDIGAGQRGGRGIPTLIFPARTGTCRNDGRSRAGSERFLYGRQRD
jgi:hypothetical protein